MAPAFRARMSTPINPPRVTSEDPEELPAYISNGVIGMRVLTRPLTPGTTIISGLSGRDPMAQVESAARAPYPLAGDVQLNGVWMSQMPEAVRFRGQSYDFSCGELTTEFDVQRDGLTASVEVVTFCARHEPTIVAQQVTVRTSEPASVTLRATVTPDGVPGRWLRRETSTPGMPKPEVDGSLLWGTLGGLSEAGIAYVTDLLGVADAELIRQEWGEASPLVSDYRFRTRSQRPVRLRQLASLVPSVMHSQPDRQAVRLVARAREVGWDQVRADNRATWQELWKGRIRLAGAPPRWQELADAAFFYLNTSVNAGSPSSTSIFGLAQWHDYHYYYGHVMWDVDTFAVPPLVLLQPDAARALLEFRARTQDSAKRNARLHGRQGLQFPWEAGMGNGEETAPGNGKASWYEDHVSLDVAMAFATYARIRGDEGETRRMVWPILRGVADWIDSRATRTDRGAEILRSMGIAERMSPSNNEAFTNMSAAVVLSAAIGVGERLGEPVPARWRELAQSIVVPTAADGSHIVSYDGWQANHEKGATPTPLAALFPHGYDAGALEAPTLRRYLDLATDYIGSPMLSALYGVWAAWAGDRDLSAALLEDGYGRFDHGRFHQTLETRPDYQPEQPKAGPFFANLGGFLQGLLLGLPGIQPSQDDPVTWARRRVVLPAGWEAIEVDRLWVRGREMSLAAPHGAERARLEPIA
jgi:hypothetical protein